MTYSLETFTTERDAAEGAETYLEHELSRVDTGRELGGAVALEIAAEDLGLFANLAEVDRLAATSEEEEAVETSKEHRRRLVDRAEDGLTVVLERLEQVEDSPTRLRVEAGRRLVEEEEELWLGDHLDSDRQALALLDVETFAETTDNGVGVLVHLEKGEDLLNIGELLGPRHTGRLAEQSAELERFAAKQKTC